MKIKIPEEQLLFIKLYATNVRTNSGNTYAYVPHWFKINDDSTIEIIRFENLPTELVEFINEIREPKP